MVPTIRTFRSGPASSDRLRKKPPEYRCASSTRKSDRAWLALNESVAAASSTGSVKPLSFITKGKRGLAQPAVKCRGQEYLRIIYGPEYTAKEHLDRLRSRGLATKRSLAIREFALGVDPVFLGELLDSASEKGITPACRHLLWSGLSPGFCEAGLPWDWQKYRDRIDALDKEQRKIAPTWSPIPTPTNAADMRRAYSHFRATLEKVTQDVILGGVVARYRSWIKVDLLEQVVGFSDIECKETLRLHKRACEVTEAHDPAAGKHAAVPSPDEFRADITALEALVEQVKQRRKATSQVGAASGAAVKASPVSTPPPS